jgi:pimeloyl-ACP methyl ester carboxylesterase
MIRHLLSSVVLSLLISSCGAPPSMTPSAPASLTPEATPTETLAPTEPEQEAAVLRQPESVVIEGAAGLSLRGVYFAAPASPAPGALLLHMYARSKADWLDFARSLQATGISALAIDLRGHGETGGDEDWALAAQDVALAYAWLAGQEGVSPDRLGIVGASIGANLALVEAAGEPSVRAIALLSPGLDYFRVRIDGLIEQYGDRPSLLVASEEDQYSADTVRILAALAPGGAELVLYTNAGHGTAMFDREPDLAERLLEFLAHALQPGR